MGWDDRGVKKKRNTVEHTYCWRPMDDVQIPHLGRLQGLVLSCHFFSRTINSITMCDVPFERLSRVLTITTRRTYNPEGRLIREKNNLLKGFQWFNEGKVIL